MQNRPELRLRSSWYSIHGPVRMDVDAIWTADPATLAASLIAILAISAVRLASASVTRQTGRPLRF